MSEIITSVFDGVTAAVRLAFRWSNPISRIGASGAVILGLWNFGRDLFRTLIGSLDQIAVGALGNADFTPLSFANYLFPIDDLLMHLTILMALTTVCALIRIIKSFIPSIA